MSKVCQVCGKIAQKNNKVPRGIGNRVTKRTIVRRKVNLRSKRLILNGSKVRVQLCASCLKRIKKDNAEILVGAPVTASK